MKNLFYKDWQAKQLAMADVADGIVKLQRLLIDHSPQGLPDTEQKSMIAALANLRLAYGLLSHADETMGGLAGVWDRPLQQLEAEARLFRTRVGREKGEELLEEAGLPNE